MQDEEDELQEACRQEHGTNDDEHRMANVSRVPADQEQDGADESRERNPRRPGALACVGGSQQSVAPLLSCVGH